MTWDELCTAMDVPTDKDIRAIAERQHGDMAKAGPLPTELQARASMSCVCGNAKELNCVCCWDCFKRGPLPYKYFDGTFEQWQIERRKYTAV